MYLKGRTLIRDRHLCPSSIRCTRTYCKLNVIETWYIFFVHLWGHWYTPVFGLLVTSPLGFKARVGSALFALGGGICDIRCLRFTSGVTPLPVYNASIAASGLPLMHVSAEVGSQDLNCRPPARQSDALPTRPQRPAMKTWYISSNYP